MTSTKKNYAYKVIYEVIAIILPLITAPYITRVLGADNLGIHTYAFSVVLIFYKVAQLGILNHGSRSIAKYQNDIVKQSIIFEEIYIIQFISALLSIIGYILYVFLLVKENRLIALIQIIYLFSAMFDISWFYVGIEDFKTTVIRDMAVKVSSLLMIFCFVKSIDDLWKYVIILLGSSFLGHISLWFGIKKRIQWQVILLSQIKKQLKPVLVLFIPTIAVLIYTLMDKIMIGQISGTTELAFYQYSANIVSIPLSFITSFGMVMLPRMSNMFATENSKSSTRKIINDSLIFVTFMACAFSFGLCAITTELIPIYYGKEFLPCIPILFFISLKLPFMAWSDVIRTQVLIPNNKDKQFILSLFSGACVNLIINISLIPNFGGIGAAIGTIAAEATVAISQAMIARNYFNIKKTLFLSQGFGVIGIIMLFSVKTIGKCICFNQIINLILEIIIGAIIYLLLSYIYIQFLRKNKSHI